MSANYQEQALIELYNIARRLASINGETQLSEILGEIVASTKKVTNADYVNVLMIDKDAKGKILKSVGHAGKALDEKTMLVPNSSNVTQASTSIVSERIKSLGTKSMVVVPIIVGNEALGVMWVAYGTKQSFTDEQIKLMLLFANQVAIALHNTESIRKSLNKKAISKMSSCFISYSSDDENFSRKLYSDLQNKHVPCWYAPADMKIGDRIRSRIDKMIREHDKLLVVLSKSTLKSQWVEQEVESALAIERKEERTILFPIRLDNSIFEAESGWATYVRNTRNIGDFTKWQDDKLYKQAIKRLLNDLRKESA